MALTDVWPDDRRDPNRRCQRPGGDKPEFLSTNQTRRTAAALAFCRARMHVRTEHVTRRTVPLVDPAVVCYAMLAWRPGLVYSAGNLAGTGAVWSDPTRRA